MMLKGDHKNHTSNGKTQGLINLSRKQLATAALAWVGPPAESMAPLHLRASVCVGVDVRKSSGVEVSPQLFLLCIFLFRVPCVPCVPCLPANPGSRTPFLDTRLISIQQWPLLFPLRARSRRSPSWRPAARSACRPNHHLSSSSLCRTLNLLPLSAVQPPVVSTMLGLLASLADEWLDGPPPPSLDSDELRTTTFVCSHISFSHIATTGRRLGVHPAASGR